MTLATITLSYDEEKQQFVTNIMLDDELAIPLGNIVQEHAAALDVAIRTIVA